MRKSKIKQISLAVCLAFMPISGYTAGLGKLNVSSSLGEPLKAEVELLSATQDELSSLTAAIASEEAYAVQGISRLGIHSNIKVELAKAPDGSPVLKLRSSLPINDPYLDMLIQVDWASGRLLREYTVLLDPPEYNANRDDAPVPVNKPVATTSASIPATRTESLGFGVEKDKKSKKNSARIDEQPAPKDADTLKTKRGDTLHSLAREMQVEGVSIDQMLVGLFENNKDAFVDGNMNRLKVGQVIKAPSKDALLAIDAGQAKSTLKVHSSNWSAYRNTLAGAVASAPVAEESERPQVASGKIAAAVDKSTPVKPGPQDVVKLSAGDKAVAKGKAAVTDAKVVALQEEATAREKALKESQGRMAALEKQIEDMRKLLALKSQTMKDLQKNAEATSKESPTPQPVEVPKVEAPKVEIAKPATTAPEPVVALVEAPSAQKQVTPPAEIKPAPKAHKPTVQAEPVAQPGFIESLFGGLDLTVLGGASGVALLGAGWMYLRNKRRKELDSFERGILTSGGLRANTVFGNTTGSVSSADTSFLTDFAQSTEGNMIDTNDVDPIAEAEVYMAYGRDAQAEEILKDAISKEPNRYELHLKLLEMYAARKDSSAFEAIAGELYTTLGSDDPTWAKVAALGVSVEPENPLYGLASAAPNSTEQVREPEAEGAMAGAQAQEPEQESLDAGLAFSLDDQKSDVISEAGLDQGDAGNQVVEATLGNEIDFSTETEVVVPDMPEEQILEVDVGQEPSAVDELAELTEVESNAPELNESSLGDSLAFDLSQFESVKEQELAPEPILDLSATMPEDATLEEVAVLDIDEGAVSGKADDNADFGMDFNLPEVTSATLADEDNSLSLPDVESADLPESVPDSTAFALGDSDLSGDLQSLDDAKALRLEKEPDVSGEEISFDFPLEETLEIPVAEAVPAKEELGGNDFDFSSISLDLDDDTHAAEEVSFNEAPEETIDISVSDVSENPDVDVKLDLVAAYIDMDDKEGARELLDEVLKEGGPQQKQRAESLLASIT